MAKKKSANKNKKQIHRKITSNYRIRYTAYDDVKTTKTFKNQLIKNINYTLSYGKTITKQQKQIIKNIQNAKTQKTIIRNLEKLRQTDYGLFKRQQSQPGIGFIGRKSRDRVEQQRIIRGNVLDEMQEQNNLHSHTDVLLYLKQQYGHIVRDIFEQYGIYGPHDLVYYADRARRAYEAVRNAIPELEDLSFDDVVFIAF